MDNTINETNEFVKWTFLDPRYEVKRPSKTKHEERTQRNAELDEFCMKQQHRFNQRLAIGLTDGLRINRHRDIGAIDSAFWRSTEKLKRHQLNRWHAEGHQCNYRIIAQRACQARRAKSSARVKPTVHWSKASVQCVSTAGKTRQIFSVPVEPMGHRCIASIKQMGTESAAGSAWPTASWSY